MLHVYKTIPKSPLLYRWWWKWKTSHLWRCNCLDFYVQNIFQDDITADLIRLCTVLGFELEFWKQYVNVHVEN